MRAVDGFCTRVGRLRTLGSVGVTDRLRQLATFQADANACTRCHDHDGINLLFVDPAAGCARPILAYSPTAALGILVVGEAPNHADTFDDHKRYLTYDFDTDRTGRFMRALLIDEQAFGLRRSTMSYSPTR